MKWIQGFFLILLSSCHESELPIAKREIFPGRYADAIYHAYVPTDWKKIPTSNEIMDTKIPLFSYKLEDGSLLTVHNFPYQSVENRIPPEAQVKRWQDQVRNGYYDITFFANGGFGGLRLEAISEEMGMIAYAMQLTPIIFYAVEGNDLKADYTIKFVGSPKSLEKNREAVDAFAQSFEWVIPIGYNKLW